jgi:hypothetical protein
MATNLAPSSPAELKEQLCRLVPTFASDWEDPNPLEEETPDTFHSVMREFTYSFGKAAHALPEARLKELGSLVDASVEHPGTLENAMATCFLEHLHQVKALKVLWPHLSQRARAECHP